MSENFYFQMRQVSFQTAWNVAVNETTQLQQNDDAIDSKAA